MEFALICGATILGFICLIVSGILQERKNRRKEAAADAVFDHIVAWGADGQADRHKSSGKICGDFGMLRVTQRLNHSI